MHIICTNFCLFTKTVVAETVSEIYELHHIMPKVQESLPIILNSSKAFGVHHLKRSVFVKNQLEKIKYLGCIQITPEEPNLSLDIQETQDKISAYLYPCVIEYSLMAMTIFYILWASIKSRYVSRKHGSYDVNPVQIRRKSLFRAQIVKNVIDINNEKAFERIDHLMLGDQQINKFTIDCGKSTTGLFFGIFVLLVTVNKIAKYHILNSRTYS